MHNPTTRMTANTMEIPSLKMSFKVWIWFFRNLADASYGMLRGCAVFHPPRFLQTTHLLSLMLLVLVLAVLLLLALMEHAKFEQIELGATIHPPFHQLEPIPIPF